MEHLIQSIATELNATKAQIYFALSRLKFVKKIDYPTPKWEKTDLGNSLLLESMKDRLIEQITEQLEIISEGPDLGKATVPARKKCRNCGVHRTNEYFGITERNPDNLTTWCLPCLFDHNAKQHYGNVL